MTIAIRVKNPARVAGRFGECAGDFNAAEAAWWVGTHRDLALLATKPAEAREINATVRFCGGDAWIPLGPKRARREAALRRRYGEMRQTFRWAYPYRVGWWKEKAEQMRAEQARGWKVTAKDYHPAITPPAPRLP